MASIGAALGRIKGELDQWINRDLVEHCCVSAGHRWRKRRIDPQRTVHLLILQLLARVALSGLRHVCELQVSAQAICAARMRLPLEVMLGLVQLTCRKLCGSKPDNLWHGLRVMLVDGMSFLTADTDALSARFGKSSNQHGKSCSYPVPKLLAMLELGSGLISKVIALPHSRQERTCLTRLLAYLSRGDLLLGDRGMAGYAQVAMMMAAAVNCCIRLPKWMTVMGRGKKNHKLIRRLGENDLLVRWSRSDRRVSWMSKLRWAALPRELVLRQVSMRVRRRGYRDCWLRVITTLTDPQVYPAEEIAQLYAKRWQVEVYFRDMKQTLGMKQMRSRSVAGVRKEICAFVLLYNLIRQVMQQSAAAMKVDADRISFTDAMRWLLFAPAGESIPRLKVNPRRRRSPEPRALKHGSRKYPLLREPRQKLRQRLLRRMSESLR